MKEFNVTGVCVSNKHYMVDISKKLEEIIKLIEDEKYFTINRARQYGKTTTLNEIRKKLKDKYVLIDISFEGSEDIFTSMKQFAEGFTDKVSTMLKFTGMGDVLTEEWMRPYTEDNPLNELGKRITELVSNNQREIILMIDEVDKSSGNQIFLSFLGMLRNKYLNRNKNMVYMM